jgi:hypothetical protein
VRICLDAHIRTIVVLTSGKQTMFTFCNYRFVPAKVYQVILGLFRLILLFMKFILLFMRLILLFVAFVEILGLWGFILLFMLV